LERYAGVLRLVIADAGAGFDPAASRAEAGLGIVSIRERVRLVGGTVEIKSGPNQGTTVTVTIPE
jgi:signal transduction histidine kinase